MKLVATSLILRINAKCQVAGHISSREDGRDFQMFSSLAVARPGIEFQDIRSALRQEFNTMPQPYSIRRKPKIPKKLVKDPAAALWASV